MKKLHSLFSAYCDAETTLKDASIKKIKEILNTIPSKSVTGLNMVTQDLVSISYNGGNHPEYNSNCYSVVGGVYLENGEIYLGIDETDEYPIDDVSGEELYFIAEMLNNNYQKAIKVQEMLTYMEQNGINDCVQLNGEYSICDKTDANIWISFDGIDVDGLVEWHELYGEEIDVVYDAFKATYPKFLTNEHE